MTPATAIYYHPEAYTMAGPKIMGRQAAGTSFLRGYAANSLAPEFWAVVDRPEYAQQFAQTVTLPNRNRPVRVVPMENLGRVAQCGTLFVPGPNIGGHAWVPIDDTHTMTWSISWNYKDRKSTRLNSSHT